jgi:hypothetical protein
VSGVQCDVIRLTEQDEICQSEVAVVAYNFFLDPVFTRMATFFGWSDNLIGERNNFFIDAVVIR